MGSARLTTSLEFNRGAVMEHRDLFEHPGPLGPSLGLVVADAGWFTTENLFREIDDDAVALLLLKCQDYVNGSRRGVYPWSRICRTNPIGPRIWERQHVLPSGWMKRFPRLGMRPIARSVRRWLAELPALDHQALVMTYPHYLELRNQLRPDVSVYYNVDDYALYWPREAERTAELERRAVRESDLTICVSRLRSLELKAAVPEASDRIHHVPHGSPSHFLADRPLTAPAQPPDDLKGLPRPFLGYAGSLEGRVDWALMDELAARLPAASFVVIGRQGALVAEPWRADCERFLNRPNVHAIGWRSQEQLPRYIQAFDVNLIPYRMDHPFNHACCPTKIMDAMAASRPIVATAIPECLLHRERFDVVDSTVAFLAVIERILDAGSDDGRSAVRLDYAVDHTCKQVARRILDLIQAVGERRDSREDRAAAAHALVP